MQTEQRQQVTEDPPRIEPGSNKDIGRVNARIVGLIARKLGVDRPPNVFTTIARHRRLFRVWSRFSGMLLLKGSLDRADAELLILRGGHNSSCAYEWHQHERIAQTVGLSADDVERVRQGPDAAGWTPRQTTLLRAADELHERRKISTPVWDELSSFLSETQLIELCMLVGHYEMLAMTLNSLQVQIDPE
jgi:alkylhydroperoxidase family enzyme